MKYIYTLSIFFLFFRQEASSQAKNPVKWHSDIKQINEGRFLLILRATVENGWHIYASSQPEGAISIPTHIELDNNIERIGVLKEIGKKEEQRISSDGLQYYYSGTVNFVQVIRLKEKSIESVKCRVIYMACTEEECLPAKVYSFSISLKEIDKKN
ncbi:hypothetical protein KTO58_04670 [Chitinophaga pendula]|uniref:protein-disulfide reductase DsbD domain-containing protein n=1 Tax=Chitinophaga TaxID=79328 RepID=UPI0012FE0C8A|nr:MULTISPECIES: protein-disulfide reductase DsbD domain-containing protein [Chitinophaga]UCJ08486.1 hypothetical protein KTO58_04670 [Chitinophaga pendula]